ncbi:MAG: carbon-nitrogen hydrolase family protein [Saprospiraceae bacterium]|nr:carbon-nitrogen hydrolase family protein [Saprospiraceae bacterium]
MKICLAQIKSVSGDFQANLKRHLEFIEMSQGHACDLILFPELSLTGYEPTLAQELEMDFQDTRLDVFQEISNSHQITIGVGAPISVSGGVAIGMVLFERDTTRKVYFKRYLHSDEEPFFMSSEGFGGIINSDQRIALAICYEISVPAHAERAFKAGAEIYMASVVKFFNGFDKALSRLSEIASQYSMVVLMVNGVGIADGLECAGRSSIFDTHGRLIGQLSASDEGLLIFDTESCEVLSTAIG